jgi:hypothetical protein
MQSDTGPPPIRKHAKCVAKTWTGWRTGRIRSTRAVVDSLAWREGAGGGWRPSVQPCDILLVGISEDIPSIRPADSTELVLRDAVAERLGNTRSEPIRSQYLAKITGFELVHLLVAC